MGVSKSSGIPKWMVKIMENPIKMDDFWGYHYFRKHPYKLYTFSGKFLGRSFPLNVDSPLASGIPLKVEGDDFCFLSWSDTKPMTDPWDWNIYLYIHS